MEIYYAVGELGNGHAYRTSRVAEKLLERGHTITFFTSHPMIKEKFGDSCKIHECQSIGWYEDRSGINIILSILNMFLSLPAYDFSDSRYPKMCLREGIATQAMSRYYDIRKYANDVKPDNVVSDGDLAMLRWAQRRDIEPIFITNQTRPHYNLREQLLLQPAQWLIEKNYIENSKIVIPDFEMPNTICEFNFRGIIGIRDDLDFVGPYMQTSKAPNGTPRDGGFIYFSIHGPYGTRARLENKFLPMLEKFAGEAGYELIVSLGDKNRRSEERGSIRLYGWLSNEERVRCMREAHIIIHSASHMTTMETIVNGKPSICIPTQPEQRGQAKKLEKLGCSIAVDKPKKLAESIIKMEDSYDFYKTHIEELMDLTKNANGVKRTVEIIESGC